MKQVSRVEIIAYHPIQYVNQYGVRKFYQRAKQLAEQYGERFNPPAILEAQAEKDEAFV